MSEKAYLPRIAQPSLWQSFVPKSFKTSSPPRPARRSNPANYFIWIYLFIGSQAIRILTLKNESAQHQRMADIKVRQLREIIEKLENGEDVDVEKMLGTGNEAAEQEWEQALRELESEERLWQNNRSRRKAERHRQEARDADADPVNRIVGNDATEAAVQLGPTPPTSPGFY